MSITRPRAALFPLLALALVSGPARHALAQNVAQDAIRTLTQNATQEEAPDPGQDSRPRADKPNIVFILSDDEDVGIHRFMPKTKALLEDQGTVFDNAFVTYSLCCPSRSSILRGQYPHNTEVLGNLPPEGGFKAFRRLDREASTIGTWLQEAGYRTAFYGKYLNGYTERDAPPPGWDEWHVANNDGYFNINYTLNENGKAVAYGAAPEDYLTDVIAAKASEHIRRWSESGEPFFLHISPFNPHSPYNAAPRHKGLFKDAELPRPPSFDEEDVSDKPSFIRNLPRLTPDDIDDITGSYRARLDCLQAVDDLVERVVDTLRETGELDDTYVVYASDNGFHLGLHRMKAGKDTAYEEDIRVPLAMRGPGVPAGRHVEGVALNIDLAPTFTAIAGARAPDFIDGRSLLPLLSDNPPDTWRTHFIVQRKGNETDERAGPLSAIAIRSIEHTYIAYENGEHELYDLLADPHQLQNLAPDAPAGLVDTYSTRLTQLKACEGERCRELEDAPLDP